MNRCGGCKLEHCVLKNNYDCLVCENFFTTPECITYFKKEVGRIDELIMIQTIPHEIEFLKIKKQLLVTYIAQLLAYKDSKGKK